MPAITEHKYRDSPYSLNATRLHLCNLLQQDIQSQGIERYCIGCHVRHVLDSSSNLVEITSSNNESANAIRNKTERSGLQTLNHVLDSLYYGPSRSDIEALVVQLSYCLKPEDRYDHCCDELCRPLTQWKGQYSLAAPDEIQASLETAVSRHFNHVKAKAFQGAINWEETPKPPLDQLTPFSILRELFGDNVIGSGLWNKYLCGVQKLCHRFLIEPSMLSYQSLMAAIYQLGLYTEFGDETTTMVFRPQDSFGCVLGFTLISDVRLNIDQVSRLGAIVAEAGKILNTSTASARWPANKLHKLRAFGGFTYGENASADLRFLRATKSVAMTLSKSSTGHPSSWLPKIGSPFGQDLEGYEENALWLTVAAFIQYCINFCEEKFEGRGLRFGIVLGNPKLLKHWPGPAPLPLGKIDSAGEVVFLNGAEVPDHFHLAEGPQNRAVVIPFLGEGYKRKDPVPAYVIDIEDVDELSYGHSHSCLWPAELRPYVFFTQRYPWAMSCVVGPGSEIRVFARGKMELYRDGKGWKTCGLAIYRDGESTRTLFRDVEAAIVQFCPKWKNSRQVLAALIGLAIQVSPITRPDSHGSLFLYADDDDCGEFWKEMKDERLKGLRFENEPPRAEASFSDENFGWLKGLDLVRDGISADDAPISVDSYVARLVLRASAVDGAVVFQGPRARVMEYGCQVIFGRGETVQVGGTKTSTAASFAKFAGARGVMAIAISISADGPVKVFWPEAGNDGFGQGVIFDEV